MRLTLSPVASPPPPSPSSLFLAVDPVRVDDCTFPAYEKARALDVDLHAESRRLAPHDVMLRFGCVERSLLSLPPCTHFSNRVLSTLPFAARSASLHSVSPPRFFVYVSIVSVSVYVCVCVCVCGLVRVRDLVCVRVYGRMLAVVCARERVYEFVNLGHCSRVCAVSL